MAVLYRHHANKWLQQLDRYSRRLPSHQSSCDTARDSSCYGSYWAGYGSYGCTSYRASQGCSKPSADGMCFVKDIESIAVKNNDFRRVLYTAKYCQLVVMSLSPSEEIGEEVHKLDQFFRIEEGTGDAVLEGVRTAISSGFAIIVPAGTNHVGKVPL